MVVCFIMQRVEGERNDLYGLFHNALSRVRDETDSQHFLLERKIENAEESITASASQLQEVAMATGMSNEKIESITETFDKQLDPLNSRIVTLQNKLTGIRKAYSNSMNNYLGELRKGGVPEDKIGEIFSHKTPDAAATTSRHEDISAAALPAIKLAVQ